MEWNILRRSAKLNIDRDYMDFMNFNAINLSLQIDVWAAGIILYILLCGFPPFVSPENQQEPLFDAILSGVYEFPEPYWTDIGDGVRDLIANMLQSDPELRFSSEDILDHFWVQDEDQGQAQFH